MKVLNKIEADFENIITSVSGETKEIHIENFNEFKKEGIPTSKQEFWKFTNPSILKDSEFTLGHYSEFEDNKF
ncbi:MAG: hypothetical protein VYE32_03095, partial [Candidatus Thermoplasmatota archaeon]|nr:hypothetical protein [Candidatus Thermoplasmatota archaeon]